MLLSSISAAADDWTDNLRWSFDAASRSQYITSGDDRLGFQTTLGLDTQQVITGINRNIATVTLQLYATRADNLRRRPPYIDADGEWQFLPKVNTVNFHINRNGRFNFLIGHPELPYGLEASISTNGTLRQLSTGRNLGLKVDWGVGINGTLTKLGYAVTLTRGSGVDYHRNGQPWALTGRIGSKLNTEDYIGSPGFGLSWFAGRVRTPMNTLVDRRRVGLDGHQVHGLRAGTIAAQATRWSLAGYIVMDRRLPFYPERSLGPGSAARTRIRNSCRSSHREHHQFTVSF
jgi:hypothetical protein